MHVAFIGVALALVGPAEPQTPERNAAGWLALSEESNLDGAKSYIATKDAMEPVLNAIGRPANPTLNVSCINDDVQVSLSWPGYLGRDEVWVDASVDRGTVHKWTFLVSQRSLAVFGGSGNWRRFTNAISGGQRITFRVHAYGGTQEATFDLDGTSDVMQVAAETCAE
ncbi:MAG: hypothetical protein ACOH1H_11260 [Brevundimonas sp.]